MREVFENGKRYLLDDNGFVLEASVAEPKVASVEADSTPLSVGDRVEVDGKLGKALSSNVPTVYGPSMSVRFDDGEIETFLQEQVKRAAVENAVFDNPVDQLRADWTEYQEMPNDTLEQIEAKASVARRLHIGARVLIKSAGVAYADQVELDKIVLTAGAELQDMVEKAARLEVASSEYLSSQPKYQLPDEINPSISNSKGDVSWLLTASDAALEELTAFDWDTHLTHEALKATARLSEEELESESFMDAVAGYREEAMPLGFDQEKRAKFREVLEAARTNVLAERRTAKTAKIAATQEELADFDPAQLFL